MRSPLTTALHTYEEKTVSFAEAPPGAVECARVAFFEYALSRCGVNGQSNQNLAASPALAAIAAFPTFLQAIVLTLTSERCLSKSLLR
jgi:hypothetical protein